MTWPNSLFQLGEPSTRLQTALFLLREELLDFEKSSGRFTLFAYQGFNVSLDDLAQQCVLTWRAFQPSPSCSFPASPGVPRLRGANNLFQLGESLSHLQVALFPASPGAHQLRRAKNLFQLGESFSHLQIALFLLDQKLLNF